MPLSHIRQFEVTEQIGPHDMEKIVLFNSNKITGEEALRYVKAGEYNPNVLCIPKKQWISLFQDGKDAL